MAHDPLTREQARSMLSDLVEGTLREPQRSNVERWMADAELARERARLERMRRLFAASARPEAPDLIGAVRARIEEESHGARVLRPKFGGRRSTSFAGRLRRHAVELAFGSLAAAGVVALFAFDPLSQPRGQNDAQAAGVVGDATATHVTLSAPSLSSQRLRSLALEAGMREVGERTFEGDARESARFIFSLKAEAAERGAEVSGFVPDAARLHIEVR